MPVGETAYLSVLLYLLVLVICIPLGQLIVWRFLKKLSPNEALLASIGVSLLSFAALVSCLISVRLTNGAIRLVLVTFLVIAVAAWVARGGLRVLWHEEIRIGLVLLCCYVLLSAITAAFPKANHLDVSANSTMTLAALPGDNLIPYNGSRFLVERINPQSQDIVPGWRFTDRGPLAALLNATGFILLGLEETAPWGLDSPGLAFVYHVVLTTLNGLSLLAVWLLGCRYLGRGSALIAVLLLGTSYFFFINVAFSWPKFLMAFFMLCSLFFWRQRFLALAGIFAAGAWLSHDSAVFCIALLLLVLILQLKREPLIRFVTAFLVVASPWLLYKGLYGDGSSRLIQLLVFCDSRPEAAQLSISEGFSRYLSANSAKSIFETKLSNVTYPFNPQPFLEATKVSSRSALSVLDSGAYLSFYQFYLALGIPWLLLVVWGIFRARSDKKLRALLPIAGIAYGSLLIASLIFGCSNQTANHVWAFVPFLVSSLVAARAVAISGMWAKLLLAISLVGNIIIGMFLLHFKSPVWPFLHASSGYTYGQLAFFGLFLAFCGWSLLRTKSSEGKASRGQVTTWLVVLLCVVFTLALIAVLSLRFKVEHVESLSGSFVEKLEFTSVGAIDLGDVRYNQEPSLSNDGRRMLFNVTRRSAGTELLLWQEGLGAAVLWSSKSPISSVVISGDGQRGAFFDNDKSLMFWEEGYEVERLLEASFKGEWKLTFSGNGNRLLLLPQDETSWIEGANKLGLLDNTSSLETLVITFKSRELVPELRAPVLPSAAEFEVSMLSSLSRTQHSGIDLDEDRAADLLTFSSASGAALWRAHIMSGYLGKTNSHANASTLLYSWRLGDSSGVPVPGDYNGDGVLDLGTFTPRRGLDWDGIRGNWQVYLAVPEVSGSKRYERHGRRLLERRWGAGHALPVAADFDGDGKTDMAVFYPDEGSWRLLYSKGGFNVAKASAGISGFGQSFSFGKHGDIPVPGDYNGDGRTDIALFREPDEQEDASGQAQWLIRYSDDSQGKFSVPETINFGLGGDIPLPGDFDCDGETELVVYRPTEMRWYLRLNEEKDDTLTWGVPGADPLVADFDGDGCSDQAFFNAEGSYRWEIRNSQLADKLKGLSPTQDPIVTKLRWGNPRELPVELVLRNLYYSYR